MNRIVTFAFVLSVIAAVAAGGYRLGAGSWPTLATLMEKTDPAMAPAGNGSAGPAASAAESAPRRVLYWRDPDGKPAYAASPLKTAEGKDYVPVHEDEEPDFAAGQASAPKAEATSGPRKILYYRNPMGLPDTSPVPKKDWMNMDYIPVYEGDEEDGSSVKVSLDKVQRAGVKSEVAEMRQLARAVRAPGIARIDERTLHDVTLRADGYIEKLYVAELGKHVKAGEPLFRVYSPDIVKAQVDFRIAKEATTGRSRAEAEKDLAGAVQRLENLNVPESVIAGLKSGTDPMPTKIDWPSPVSGVVIEKKVVAGQKVSSGDMLYRIADLGSIWVIADVAEQDIGPIKDGAPATVVFRAFPDERFEGHVTFILHELDMATRTAKVRIEIKNPEHRIRHDMFADVTIDAGSADGPRLAVPVSAVLDTGVRQVVLLDKGDGRFEPKPVKLGVRGDGYVEIKEGIAAGDKVVTTANFLIDAESNLKAALKGFTSDAPAPADAKPVPGPGQTSDTMKPVDGSAEAKPLQEGKP